MQRVTRFLLLLAALAACTSYASGLEAPAAESAPVSSDAHENGLVAVFVSEPMRLTAIFGDGGVRLFLADGRDVFLPRAISASGARFTDGSIEFWNKGDEARLEIDGTTYLLLVEDEPVDPWLKAQRAGVDFRAVGQEPGWLVEIREGDRIHLVLDYGLTTITTPVSWPEVNSETGTVIYRTPRELSPFEIEVTVEHRTCVDSMSGEVFPDTVTVEFLGRGYVYHGCGRRLE